MLNDRESTEQFCAWYTKMGKCVSNDSEDMAGST